MSFDNSKVIATKGFLIGAADAIRRKLGTSDTITLPNFESAIDSIPSGGGEPYIPKKQLISEFDFTSYTPWKDIVKNASLGTLMHYGTTTQGVGVEFTARGHRIRTGTIFDFCSVYEMEVEFGAFNKSYDINTGNNFLLCFSRNNYTAMLCFRNYNSETGLGDWWIHDQKNNNIYLDDIHDPYYFENKKLTILFGAKLVNSEMVLDLNKIYYYVNGVQLNSVGAVLPGDVDASVGVVHLGDRSSSTFQGAVYKGFKMWQWKHDLDDTDDIIQPITITANGTYTADGNTVAGYSPITVNIHEVLESEFDLLHSGSTLGFLDIVKHISLPTDAYSGFNNGYITDRNVNVPMHTPNYGDVKRIVVKTGEFDRSAEPSEEWLNLMRLNTSDWHFNLTYNTSGDYWRVSDVTGATIDIPASTLPKYAFEDTTFEIIFGAKYINGELYRGIKTNGVVTENYTNRLYVYLNDNLVMENQYQEIYPTIRVGGGNGWTGAKFENAKIYNVLDCYDKYYETPVSLMSASPSEIKSSSETESIDEKSIDESIKEDEKSIEEEKADDIKEILDDENNFETKK